MRVLVACEYSGRVRDAFRRHGHDAMSCDLLPTEAPGPHHQGPVQDVLNDGWDLMVAHPPCTDLAISGSRWLAQKQADGRTDAALAFVRLLMEAPIDRWCIENPASLISSRIRQPDQIIQPWQFGHGETKATCLWLKNLPPLRPTHVVEGRESRVHRMPPGPDRWKERSRTYEGVADAMGGGNGAVWRCLLSLSSWRWLAERATYPQPPAVTLMAWGDWMCPIPGPEHELELERQRRSIASYDLQHAQDMLWRLAQLCQRQDLILRAATRRIAELECREALRD